MFSLAGQQPVELQFSRRPEDAGGMPAKQLQVIISALRVKIRLRLAISRQYPR
jgi:hypothetical protein